MYNQFFTVLSKTCSCRVKLNILLFYKKAKDIDESEGPPNNLNTINTQAKKNDKTGPYLGRGGCCLIFTHRFMKFYQDYRENQMYAIVSNVHAFFQRKQREL